MMLKLKSVRARGYVPFPGSPTLECRRGSLELDAEAGLILCTPTEGANKGRTYGLPVANVEYFEVLTAEHAAKLEAVAAARAAMPKPADVTVFVKDATGKIVEKAAGTLAVPPVEDEDDPGVEPEP